MDRILVLGQIPGTSFQINFNTWLMLAAFGLLVAIARRFGLLPGIQLSYATEPQRTPLHASQLHRRV